MKTDKQEETLEAELELEERKEAAEESKAPHRNTLPTNVLKYLEKRMKKQHPEELLDLQAALEEAVAPSEPEPVDELEALRQRFNKLK